jgi:hypothetical protein
MAVYDNTRIICSYVRMHQRVNPHVAIENICQNPKGPQDSESSELSHENVHKYRHTTIVRPKKTTRNTFS